MSSRKKKVDGTGTCPIHQVPCPEHLFIHGKEAEELREGIEQIMKKWQLDATTVAHQMRYDLQLLLDCVDARDSLAFCELKEVLKKRKGPKKVGQRAEKG